MSVLSSIKWFIICVVVCTICGVGVFFYQKNSIVQNSWQQLASKDLEAMKSIISHAHPGMVDPQNPDFASLMEKSFQAAKSKVSEVNSYEGYAALINYFAASFNDWHLTVEPTVKKVDLLWPRFIVSYRKDNVEIAYVDPLLENVLPPVGTRLIAVDGVPVEKALLDRIAPYYTYTDDLHSKMNLMPFLLVDDGNPFVPTLKTCDFDYQGYRLSINLQWESISNYEFSKLLKSTQSKKELSYAIRELADKGIWISIPSFKPLSNQNKNDLNLIIQKTANFRDRPYIVIDFRGNSGGNGLYILALIKSLWGNQYADWIRENKSDYVEWRTSLYAEELVENMLKNTFVLGISAQQEQSLSEELAKLKIARQNGEDFFHHPFAKKEATPEKLNKAKVFVLTDGFCGSACARFLDYLLPHSEILHVGQATGKEGLYTHVHQVLLPSTLTTFGVPTKVLRNLSRGNYEAYTPQYVFEDDIADTASLEKWIHKLYNDHFKI